MIEKMQAYFGTAAYLFVLLVFIGVLILKKKNTVTKKLLFSIGFFVLCYPFLFVICKVFQFEEESYRLLWLLPMSIVIAYISVFFYQSFLEKLSSRKAEVAVLFLLFALVIFTFGNILTSNVITIPENIYKIDSEVIEIADLIENDAENQAQNPKIVGERSVMIQIRQYSEQIDWAYDNRDYMRQAHEFTEHTEWHDNKGYQIACAIQENIWDNPEDFTDTLYDLSVDYLVLDKDNEVNDWLLDGATQIVGKTKHYIVLKLKENVTASRN